MQNKDSSPQTNDTSQTSLSNYTRSELDWENERVATVVAAKA